MTSIDTQNSNLNDFDNPQQFISKLSTLHQQLPHVLDDFIKYYIFYNKNPDYPEYSQMFENIKSNLNNINAGLFTLSNSVDVNTNNISTHLFALNSSIKKEKVINRKLKHKLGILEQKIDSTDEMIDDYSQMYDESYLHNWALFLSILASGLAISLVFKK
jgi:CCR4-NOT transcriptional regulation complex NOT5 subunit